MSPPPPSAGWSWGATKPPELAFIRQYLPRDLDVVDLGASIGVGSALIAQRLSPARRLICVEANPHLLPLLARNVGLNTAGCALTVLNQAIDYSGQPSVRLDIQAVNTNSRLSRDGVGVAVVATTLSRLVRDFALPPFALIADIEGAELGLILHDAAALSQVQTLIIELHAAEYQGAAWPPERLCAALLATHHFQLRAQRAAVYVFDRPAPPAA